MPGSSAFRLHLTALIAALLLAFSALALGSLAVILNAGATRTGGDPAGIVFAFGPGLADAVEIVTSGPTLETTAIGLSPADLPLVFVVAWLALIVPCLAIARRAAGRMVLPIEASVAGLISRYEDHERERRRLVDDAAHEVRNPLAVMRTNLEVALSDPTDVATLRTAAEVSQRAGERIERTVEDLRREFQEGARQAARTPVDLAALVREIALEYRAPAAQRGVEIQLSAPDGLQIEADAAALKGALSNLVANALRFAPPGTPVRLAAGRSGAWRWVGVRDFGPGLAGADQALVFRRAWRADGQTGDGGAGIGLALVRQVAEAHGGSVRLTSVPRYGSSFVIWLPAPGTREPIAPPSGGGSDPLWQSTAPRPA